MIEMDGERVDQDRGKMIEMDGVRVEQDGGK